MLSQMSSSRACTTAWRLTRPVFISSVVLPIFGIRLFLADTQLLLLFAWLPLRHTFLALLGKDAFKARAVFEYCTDVADCEIDVLP